MRVVGLIGGGVLLNPKNTSEISSPSGNDAKDFISLPLNLRITVKTPLKDSYESNSEQIKLKPINVYIIINT